MEGKIVVISGGVAVCNDCGMEYSKERLQEKLSLQKEKEASIEQPERWRILAEEAYINGNYEEAYSLFCHITNIVKKGK